MCGMWEVEHESVQSVGSGSAKVDKMTGLRG